MKQAAGLSASSGLILRVDEKGMRMTVAEQMAIIKRGTVEILVEKELEEKLAEVAAERRAAQNQGRF